MAALRLAQHAARDFWIEPNLALGVLGRFEIIIPHIDGLILIFIRRNWLNRIKLGRYRFGKLITIVIHDCRAVYHSRVQMIEHIMEMMILIFAIIFAFKSIFHFVKILAKVIF